MKGLILITCTVLSIPLTLFVHEYYFIAFFISLYLFVFKGEEYGK